MTEKNLEVPEQSASDIAHTLAKAVLSTIPIIGGPAAEFFQSIIQPPVEKRKMEWMAQVGNKLHELEEEGLLRLDQLQNNKEFLSAVMHASQIALRTHQAAKLDALRNAIINIAQGKAPDETLQSVFLNLVDSFTELHLSILKIAHKPKLPTNMTLGSLRTALVSEIPSLANDQQLLNILWTDLFIRGLVKKDHLEHHVTGSEITEFGSKFLKFIENNKT